MDLVELGSNLGLEEDEFMELVELFIETAHSDISKMQTAEEQGDADKVSDSAHSLKGSSGNLGFSELSAVAKIAEDKSNNSELDGFKELFVSMKQLLEQIEDCVKK